MRLRSAVLELQPKLEEISRRLEEISRRLDALETQLVVRLDRLQLGVDAARLDSASLLDQQALHRTSLQALTSQVAEHQFSEMTEARINGIADVAGLLLQRSDSQLQRVAITVGQDIALRTPDGYLLSPAEDAITAVMVYEGMGRLEPGTVTVIQRILREGDCYVDVGANIGLLLLPAARKIGPRGCAHAVEPSTRLQGVLRRSLALNGIADRVVLHPCAAGAKQGVATLNLGAVHGHSSLLDLPDAIGGESVRVERLDDLIAAGQSIRLVKIDAEGFELQVLQGMTRILLENPDMAILAEFGPSHLERNHATIDAWLDAFAAKGRKAYEVDERDGTLRALRARGELVSVCSLNILFLPLPPDAYQELMFK